MKFILLKQDVGATITKFHVRNSNGDTIGAINTRNEDAADLERHWLGGATQSQAAATSARRKENSLVAEMLAAGKRPGARPAATADKPNPMVGAMVAVAKRNKLSKQAVLRGC